MFACCETSFPYSAIKPEFPVVGDDLQRESTSEQEAVVPVPHGLFVHLKMHCDLVQVWPEPSEEAHQPRELGAPVAPAESFRAQPMQHQLLYYLSSRCAADVLDSSVQDAKLSEPS